MKKIADKISNKIEYLYELYELYIYKHNDTKINVLIQDNSISFYLYNEKQDLDELTITFSDKEYKLYTYLSIKTMLTLLGNVFIYTNDNEFYNNTHKPYLKLIVNDDKILNIINKIVINQENTIINENMEDIEKIKSQLPRRYYSNQFIQNLENRIELSKKLLRSDSRKW